MADDAVVVDVHVSYLARVARLAEVHLAVNDDAYAYAPADVDEHYVAVALAAAFQIFAVGHAARVVVDACLYAEFLCQRLGEWAVEAREVVVCLSFVGVDTSADAHAGFAYEAAVYA